MGSSTILGERVARPPQPHPENEGQRRLRAMPTPGSTKERKARANRRLPNNVKTNGSGTDAGAVIIGEGLPRGTFLCDIGYLRVIFTLGLLLR